MLHTETLTQCPVCSTGSFRHLLTVPDHESHTGDYDIDECISCGVAFTNPRPLESELPKLYEQRSTADFPTMDGFVQRLRNLAIDRYLESQIDGDRPAARSTFDALDFGCGDGALAFGLVRYGRKHDIDVRATAVDFHDVAPAALANPTCVIRYLRFDRWQATGQRYHAIFLRHVLEHHPEPCRLLGELATALHPGGRVFVEVPNRRSVWARVLRRNYFGYYVPRHLLHFDRGSARFAFERAGFGLIEIRYGHTPVLGHSAGYLVHRDVSNTGIFGLATYPLQLMVDMAARTSTTLRIIASAGVRD